MIKINALKIIVNHERHSQFCFTFNNWTNKCINLFFLGFLLLVIIIIIIIFIIIICYNNIIIIIINIYINVII